jgi:predicted DNA binding CopG/RHH family protein
MITKQPLPMNTKISVRLNDKQLKTVQKAAKAHKMNLAEYVRACIL